jgi:glycosyltransferase involved in cell wall biosynthesis
MRILVLTDKSDLPEHHIIKGLIKKGANVSVVANPECKRTNSLEGAKIYHHITKARFDLSTILFLRSIFKSEKFDVAIYFNSRLLTAALLVSSGVKNIAYRGTSGHLSWWDPTSRLTYLSPKVDKIMCVSNAVKKYFLSLGVDENKLVTIYKGHDISWYESNVTLSDLGITERPKCLVSCVANVRPVKGVHVLIEAWKRLPDYFEGKLLLIGSVPKNFSIAKNVIVTGYLENGALYSGLTDIFVMPSIDREGLPKALLEAMAQGVAPICTNVGGMPEIVRDGIDGIVVPPSDPESLSKAILTLATDSEGRKRFGESSKDRVKRDFSIEKTVQSVFALCESLLTCSPHDLREQSAQTN